MRKRWGIAWCCAWLLLAAACGSVQEPSPGGADASVDDVPEGTPKGVVLSFEPDKIDFGTTLVGSQSVSVKVTIYNRGDTTSGPLAVDLSGGDAPDFVLDASTCAGAALASNSSCTLNLTFKPLSPGNKRPDLAIAHGNYALRPLINGVALLPGALATAPGTWDFGRADLGTTSATRRFTITNTGGSPTSALSTSTSHNAFVISNNLCAGVVLAAGAACTLDITFTPAAADLGAKVGSLVATTTATGSAVASVAGTGEVLVTISRAGAGTGSVSSSPAGLACGTTCSGRFSTSTLLLIAGTTGSNNFIGWSGACSGATSVCTLTLSQAATVQATFETYKQLTVTKDGTAGTLSGTLSSSPAGISCGASCSSLFPHGEVVTLTPTPANSNRVFAGWSGACSGGGACTVSMTQARSVTATFNCVTPSCTKSGCTCP